MGRNKVNLEPSYIASQFIEHCEGKPIKSKVFGNYRIEGTRLVYRAQSSDEVTACYDAKDFTKWRTNLGERIAETDGSLIQDGKSVLLEALTHKTAHSIRLQYFETNLIAFKNTAGRVVVNADVLPLIGRTVSYGHVRHNRSESDIQRAFNGHAVDSISFNKHASNPDLESIAVIESGLYSIGKDTYLELEAHTVRAKLDAPVKSIMDMRRLLNPVAGANQQCSATHNVYFEVCAAPVIRPLTDRETIQYLLRNSYGAAMAKLLHLNMPSNQEYNAINNLIPQEENLQEYIGAFGNGLRVVCLYQYGKLYVRLNRDSNQWHIARAGLGELVGAK